MNQTPAPASYLDCAADCIEAGDEIGRLVFLRAHAAGLSFTAPAAPVALHTTINTTGRYFPAKYASTCVISGLRFYPGADVYRTTDGAIVTLATVRAWEFTVAGDACTSKWIAPTNRIMALLADGAMVATMSNAGIKRYWMAKDGKIVEVSCTGGPTMLTIKKSPSAFWSTVASKGQAVRVMR